MRPHWLVPVVLSALLSAQAQPRPAPFGVHCVDAKTGRGVPLVELRTVDQLRFVSDSNGWCAIDEPDLLGRRVYFHIASHGYEVASDGFGYRGAAFECKPGARAEVRLTRHNIAERLYRVTGAGIYRDSVLLGEAVPIASPLGAGGVFGQDSVVNAIYRDRLWWFWGDTNRAAYPLGNFAVAGATSQLPGDGGLSPAIGVDLQYFVDAEGFARRMCPIEGPGPVWIFGPMVVGDGERERMLCHYARMKDLGTRHEHGIAVWDDAAERFVKRVEFPLDTNLHPSGNPLRVRADGGEWFVFTNPYPTVRVPADFDAILDPARYEGFTAGDQGARWSANAAHVDGPEPWKALRDVETGKPIRAHGGTIRWNAHRRRFVMIALEAFGRSPLGEVWFAEADTVQGPWSYARRIVTHDRYSFYNVAHHACFDADGGRTIYFEGTYTATFSGNPDPTPRYDYNQVMYRLDLDDPRLRLPVPVYEVVVDDRSQWLTGDQVQSRGLWDAVVSIPFHALPDDGSSAGRADVAARAGFRAQDPTDSVATSAMVELHSGVRDAATVLFTADSADAIGSELSDVVLLGRVWPSPAQRPPLWPSAVEATRPRRQR